MRQFSSNDTDKWLDKFGKGGDGSSYSTPANEGCSGTSGTKTLTLASAGSFANGDLLLIHQSRGTNAGNWELNKIASGGGTTTLTLVYDLQNTYTDSGANQAQALEMKEYKNLTTGGITIPLWDGSKGGIAGFFDNGTTNVDNTINGDGRAYQGGTATADGHGKQGEGTAGAGGTQSASSNGNGGGAGINNNRNGAGGGNGTAGQTVDTAIGGTVSGNAELTLATFGGGGGSGADQSGTSTASGAGGRGGALVFIFAKNFIINGAITVDGANGLQHSGGGSAGDGGGGAGGSVFLKCQNGDLGSNKVGATGGTGFSSAGNGGVGRIRVEYSKSLTGTTNPTASTFQDKIFNDPPRGGFLLSMVN